jgi:hypothetical protein
MQIARSFALLTHVKRPRMLPPSRLFAYRRKNTNQTHCGAIGKFITAQPWGGKRGVYDVLALVILELL